MQTTDPYVPPTGGPTPGPTDEAGAADNRVSINPSDKRWKSLIDGWDDGGEYDVKAKLRQVSPGKFELLALEEDSGAPADEKADDKTDDKTDDVANAGADSTPASDNPAVQSLMD